MPPTWDSGNQAIEADFGGQWDTTINEISVGDEWTTVMRKSRANQDRKIIRSTCCSNEHNLYCPILVEITNPEL
jgi:hypothetical protein